MVWFWVVVAIMAPVALFGAVAAVLIIGFDRAIDADLPIEDEDSHWVSLI
jgi:hypothetical protein